jgi:hypothetical protein
MSLPRHLAETPGEHRDVVGALVLEDPELRRAVVLEARVAVEVVGREVEQDGDARPKRVDVLELKARELADDPRVLGERAVQARERVADVPRDRDGGRCGPEDRTEKLARRRLPVRARHADDRIGEEPEAELDLAPDGQATLARGGHEGCLRRNAGAFDEQVHAVEQLGVVRAEDDFDAVLAKPPRVQPCVAIDADDRHAAPGKRERRRLPRAREAEHERSRGRKRGHGTRVPGAPLAREASPRGDGQCK